MSKTERGYGTDHPDKIDLVSEKGGVCYFYVIQADDLDDERILLLQAKLNNYLAFILDGQLEQEDPEKYRLGEMVKVELQYVPSGVASKFLALVKGVFQREAIGFEYGVSQR